MNASSLCLSLFITLFSVSPVLAENSQLLIEQISQDLKQTTDAQAKSSLHIYRARQYAKIHKFELALRDYNDALELNHKGWIHLERSHFLLAAGKYELAYEDANAAKEEVPTLAREADKVIEKAVAEVRKKYEEENPVSIVMDSRVDGYRKTRFDLMKEQGVGMFAAGSQRRGSGSAEKRPAAARKIKADCTPKSRS